MKSPGAPDVNDSRLLLRLRTLSHHITWFLGTRFTGTFPLVFVMGFPKSGTTWVSQLAADYLQLPFPRHPILPVGCPAVVHGHELASRRFPRGIYVMRDGRDALTSMYFFNTRRLSEGRNPRLNKRLRRKLPGLVDRDDVAHNIGPFVESQMTRPLLGSNWGQHVRSYSEAANRNLQLLRYENLHTDGPGALANLMRALTRAEPDMGQIRASINRFSFERQTGRVTGEADRTSFLRKGQSGDWRNHFTIEAAEIFDHYCGDALVETGYESDRSWLARFREFRAAQPVDTTADASSS